MKHNRLWVWTSFLLVGAFVISACNLSTIFNRTDNEQTVEPSEEPGSTLPPVEGTEFPPINTEGLFDKVFASYPAKSVNLPSTFTGGYTLPLTADQVAGMEEFGLSAAQEEALMNNGFVVLPPKDDPYQMYSEFYQLYESYRYSTTPIFVTTDSIFHVYHLVFDKMLRDLEKTSFIPLLEELTTAMVDSSLQQYEELKGTSLEQAALRNLAYFSVAGSLLDLQLDVPSEAQILADQEITLINSKAPMEASPIWTMGEETQDELLYEDYSQYIPRGHYTRSEALEKYFKTMMWYGRMTYRLKYTIETQRALLMIQAMRNAQTSSGRSALELWQNIYDPTVFIVGKADDLSIYEYGAISDQVFGETPELISFGDETKMAQFMEAAKTLPPPQINSMWVFIWQDRDEVTQGFRFMGQRFTLDQYVFGQLIFRKVGTLEEPRALPKALDVLAAMGSDEAYRLLEEMGETEYLNYESQMEKVRAEVAGFGLDSWTQNLYWSWLYAMQPLFEVKGDQFPAFMQTQAWLHKDMSTALSTWTELKHDTILYAKQVMAEMGGGQDEVPPHGYVEPNPEAFARLLALAEMTYAGLNDRGLMDETTQGNLENLIDELQFLLDMSQRELNGGTITDEDYWELTYYGGWLEAMTIAAADPAEDIDYRAYLEDQKSALVADVASGYGQVLEEGVGYPTEILVISPEDPWHLTVGGVYTYYEFTLPASERMTDETWQALLASGDAPEMPEWTKSYIVP